MNHKATDVVVFNLTGALLILASQYNEQWDKDHSLNHTIEECLLAGIEAKKRSKEYSEKARNSKLFEAEIKRDPTVVLDPKRMGALLRKYKMGGVDAGNKENPISALLDTVAPVPAEQPAPATQPTDTAPAVQ